MQKSSVLPKAPAGDHSKANKKLAGSRDKSSFKSRISLAFYLGGTNLLLLALALSAMAGLSLKLLKENKYRDVVTILGADAEDMARNMANSLAKIDVRSNRFQGEFKVARYDAGKKAWTNIRGFTKDSLSEADLGLTPQGIYDEFYFSEVQGDNYLVRKAKDAGAVNAQIAPDDLVFFPVNLGFLVVALGKTKHVTTNYFVTRAGKLIFANTADVSAATLAQRPIVKTFIDHPVSSMQTTFLDPATRQETFGSFVQVGRTNLTLFSETKKDDVTREIHALIGDFAVYSLIILVLCLLALYFANGTISRSLADLVAITHSIRAGDFQMKVKHYSFGELNKLATSFSDMTKALSDRDQRINSLVVAERQGALLQNEMIIAQEIQNSFLLQISDPIPSQIELGSLYIPSGFVAGDWFGHYYSAAQDKYFIMIADVSGHSTGSAMYTSVIASLFEYGKSRGFENYTVLDLFTAVNSVFLQIGKRKWHTTACCAEFDFKSSKLTLYNAGHPFPYLLQGKGDDSVIKTVRMASAPLGLFEAPEISQKVFDLSQPLQLLLFTDGLLEGKNKEGKAYGNKKLMNTFKQQLKASPSVGARKIGEDFLSFISAPRAEDDVCTIVIRYKP
jgi:serine phosphatase RsbU (regulator of sigma subunit)